MGRGVNDGSVEMGRMMVGRGVNYLRISRTPLAGLCFVLPIVLLYETGYRLFAHPSGVAGGGTRSLPKVSRCQRCSFRFCRL